MEAHQAHLFSKIKFQERRYISSTTRGALNPIPTFWNLIFHFRIPERVVHARGTGAHGYFKVFDDRASKYTFAPVLTDSSRTTPIFVRFSTVQGSKGSAVGPEPPNYNGTSLTTGS